MSRIVDDNLVLSFNESMDLIESLLAPKAEILAKRNVFFEAVDELQVENEVGGAVLIEIPVGDISSLIDKEDDFYLNQYCFSREAFIEVDYCNDKTVQMQIDCVEYNSKSRKLNIYYDAEVIDVSEAA